MAVIEVSVAGGNSNENGAYVGGVQPTNADDLLIPAGAGAFKTPTGVTLACRSIEIAEAWTHEYTTEGTGVLSVGGATSKADKVAIRMPSGKVNQITISLVGSSGNTEKVFFTKTAATTSSVWTIAATAGTTYVLEEGVITAGAVTHTSGGLTVNATQEWLSYAGSNSNTRTLNIENQLIKVTGTGTVWTTSVTTNLTLKAAGSTIQITDTSATGKSFVSGTVEQTYGSLKLPGGASIPKIKITQSVSLNNLEFTEGQKVLLEPTKSITIKLNRVVGAKGTAGNKIVIESATAATFFTIEARIVSTDFIFDFCTFKDVKAVGAGSNFYAGANSTNVSGNTNLKFEAAPVHEHTLTITQAQTPTRTTTPSRTLSGTQAQAVTRATTEVRVLAITQAQAAVKTSSPARALSAAQPQSATRAEALARGLSAAQAQSASRAGALTRTLSTTQAQSATRTAAPLRVFSATQAQAVARAASPTRALATTQAQAASLTGSLTRVITLTVAQEETLTHTAVILRVLEVGQPQAQAMRQTVARSFAIGQAQSATEAASPTRQLTVGQAQTVSQLHGHSNLLTLEASQAQSCALARRPARTLSVTGTPIASLVRQPLRLSTTQPQAASLARSPHRTLAVGVASSPSLARSAQCLVVTTQAIAPQLARAVARTLGLASTQAVTVVGALPEAAPLVPGKLTSSTVAATMTSSVESHDSSSVEPVLLAESSVD